MLSTGEVEPAAIVSKLRQALTAVNDLSSERAALEEALKVEKNRDNILPRIMASSGNYDALFREEIRKYDKLKVLEPPRFDQWISAASLTSAGVLTVLSCSFRAQPLQTVSVVAEAHLACSLQPARRYIVFLAG